jgi:hypothetical protein
MKGGMKLSEFLTANVSVSLPTECKNDTFILVHVSNDEFNDQLNILMPTKETIFDIIPRIFYDENEPTPTNENALYASDISGYSKQEDVDNLKHTIKNSFSREEDNQIPFYTNAYNQQCTFIKKINCNLGLNQQFDSPTQLLLFNNKSYILKTPGDMEYGSVPKKRKYESSFFIRSIRFKC